MSTLGQSNQVMGVVLAVGVVVALLGAAELVAAEEQRHPEGEEQGGEHGPPLAGPEGDDVGVVGRPLGPAVPRPVVVGAVPVVLAVGLVVLGVVGDQVGQGEAVVDGDQVDRRGGPPARPPKRSEEPVKREAKSPEQARRGCARSPAWCRGTCRSTPATAAGTARARSCRVWPTSHGSAISLACGHDRVLGDQIEEGRDLVEAAFLAGQAGRQVEAEAVHAHLGQPVPQRVHDQPQGDRISGVEGVAAAGGVHVVAAIARRRGGSRRGCPAPGSRASGRGGRPRRCG